jgi:hypothetical protein
MEIEETRIPEGIRPRGLETKARIEFCRNPKTENYVRIMGKGIHKKWLLLNLRHV